MMFAICKCDCCLSCLYQQELKAVASVGKDGEVSRLVGDMEDTLNTALPAIGSLDWQTELDLALQPLRSENADLRR